MEKDFQNQRNAKAAAMKRTPGFALQLAVVILLASATMAAAGFFAHRLGKDEATGTSSKLHEKTPVHKLFQDWPKDQKPDLVLVISGERYGYIQPCGCSKPQYGGLDRLYNFLEVLKERQWPFVTVDLGDVAQKSGIQRMKKYKLTMESMKKMGFLAVGVGINEMSMPLIEALANYSLENPTPSVVAANLLGKKEKFVDLVKSVEVSKPIGKEPVVGVIGMVGPSVVESIRDSSGDLKFESVAQLLPDMIKEIDNKKAEVRVLLYQGSLKEAEACAARFQQFNVIVCRTREDEPSEKPETVGDTMIVGVGHKGRYVGVVGFFRTGKADKPFDLRYQLVPLGPDLEWPDKPNPIIDLFEQYSKELEKENYLEKNPRSKHPIQLEKEYRDAVYVGSAACKSCHKREYKIWAESAHAHAYQTLVDSTRPSGRQFDAECIVCHVIGFDHESGFVTKDKTPKLLDVGCENCHGPGSLHVKGNTDEKMLRLMNPYKTQPNETEEEAKRRINLLDQSCQKCHDQDNDVHWSIDKWKKIAH